MSEPTHPAAPPLWVIFGVTITGILANTLVNAPLPDILDAFDRPDGDAGIFVASATIPGIFAALAIGLLADRVGRRVVLVPCLVGFGVTGLAAGAAPTFEILLLLRFAQGIAAAGLINLAVVIIGDSWEGAQRARYFGYNAAVLTGSLAVVPALGGLLTELGGWRASFAPYGIGLVAAVVVHRKLPPDGATGTATLRGQLRDAGAILRTPLVLAAVGWGFVVFVLIFGLFLTVLPLHLEQEFGLSAGNRGLVIAVPAIGSSVAALLLGRVRRRIGGRRVVLAAGAMFAVGFVVIGWAGTLPLLAAGALIYGLGEGSAIPTVQDLVTSAAPTASRGAVVAVFVSSIRAGQSVGPMLAGPLIERIGTGEVFVLGAGLAAALLVAMVVIPLPR